MNWYVFGFFFGIFLTLTSAVFVYLKGRKNLQNRLWCIICLILTVWQAGRYMTAVSIDEKQALLWCKVVYVGAIFILPISFHFISVLLNKTREQKKLIVFAYFLGGTELILSFTNILVEKMELRQGIGFYENPGKLYTVYFLTYVFFASYIIYELARSCYSITSSFKRIRIKYITIASVLGFAGGFTAFFPVFDLKILPFAAPFASFYLSLISYALIYFKIMDITYLIKKGFIDFMIFSLLLIPTYFLILFGEKHFLGETDYFFTTLTTFMTFLIGGVLPRYRGVTQRSIEEVLFKGDFNYEDTVYKLTKMIAGILDLKTLLKMILESLVKTMNITKAAIILLDDEKGVFKIEESCGYDNELISPYFSRDNFFANWIKERNDIIIKEEIEKYYSDSKIVAVANTMKNMEAEVFLPLIIRERLIGIVSLGRKESGEMYSGKDIELLMILAHQSAVAIENAKLYDNLKKSKTNMQRADRLASLGTLTAGLAHEIRNPLVSIKTFLQLLPERFDDKEFRTNFLNLTVEEVERISRLLSELLDFAKPSKPNLNEEDINEVIEKIALLVNNQAKKKNISINKNYNTDLPKILMDREQMKQVFLNTIMNAIHATSEGGEIFITTRYYEDRVDIIQVEISDTGEGIPEKDIENIFTPFFTTKHTGTGLGLSISHQIVQEHRGTINVKSQTGKGSSFFINLPVNPRRYERRRAIERHEKQNISLQ
ncbi:MAG: hypothetical protein A3C43_12230 [Candidatus Schekmanbacteria bacterium RIFCSPHIGHO2_02_FULL_38_11]|uniref:histidine kinase n=1 Tax=Candidatus Schekmanbacteria bacterium RIFCSPLOWO2_12_FULL_38_15 TaxID=1817883 RepID=A0A1F7SI29_9BACT|nr:MAG: hypothetical protein A2043_04010 [Candidatus Schekmanbacteria bacterium GWA2_38_9]OGL50814.1 MAG: hypothetical protein A3H37_03110 [Candidatus Schekmanbacteria bacterium RIFCSPLOWO2_02_FULL_38_14]OGL53425.1 MAG: hypothetical protein A3G31_07955 [Candidatus Schekmanbacteria bacterium RIFCSPLOWO2_12_FULL_38_15]OGL55058.1 MAG: hypothetical protein A3C43_12230 [Candidatus Schekmanbacteria bacterium RIFCSPHIGHO2_02_FULL_38_11]